MYEDTDWYCAIRWQTGELNRECGKRPKNFEKKLPDCHSIQITDRAACDLELIATGGFSPIDRFMGKDDFESVVRMLCVSQTARCSRFP